MDKSHSAHNSAPVVFPRLQDTESGKTESQESAICLVSSGWFSPNLPGSSAKQTINVFTAPCITFIIADDTSKPIAKPSLQNDTVRTGPSTYESPAALPYVLLENTSSALHDSPAGPSASTEQLNDLLSTLQVAIAIYADIDIGPLIKIVNDVFQ